MRYSEKVGARTDALYGYLQDRRGEWTLQRDVYFALRGLYSPLGKGSFHDSTARRELTADVRAINASDKYDEIVIWSDEGLKIANRDEAARFVGARMGEVTRQMRHIETLQRKIGGATMPLATVDAQV